MNDFEKEDEDKRLQSEKVRQYIMDKYNLDKRQELENEVAEKTQGQSGFGAALAGFGAGLQGKSVTDTVNKIKERDSNQIRQKLNDFDTGRKRAMEDLQFTQDSETQALENDPMSQQSKIAQSLAQKMLPNKDFSGMSAKQLNQMLPSISKFYQLEQNKLASQRKMDANTGPKGSPLTDAQKQVDRDYAKRYNTFTDGGRTNASNAISKLDKLADEIAGDTGFGEAGGGRFATMLPDVMRSRTAIERRDDARNFANVTLKELFGGQLSDAEREAAAREYWNDSLDNESNAKRMKAKIKELKDAFVSKEKKAKYYERFGTLQGYDSGENQVASSSMSPSNSTPSNDGYIKVKGPKGRIKRIPIDDVAIALQNGGELVDEKDKELIANRK